ncbi:Uncharacterised protein [Photobacterium damselae]|uniref:Uncharacterized protein n=1 Tax=Photobacterium damselae TaxID=38293 RepID=A0A2X1XNF2_PHODM|nr:Uncharacterised protein [Photobacterium damselae]
MSNSIAIRASILHFINDPVKTANISDSYQYLNDGLLVI